MICFRNSNVLLKVCTRMGVLKHYIYNLLIQFNINHLAQYQNVFLTNIFKVICYFIIEFYLIRVMSSTVFDDEPIIYIKKF